jgi:hypothetical protein
MLAQVGPTIVCWRKRGIDHHIKLRCVGFSTNAIANKHTIISIESIQVFKSILRGRESESRREEANPSKVDASPKQGGSPTSPMEQEAQCIWKPNEASSRKEQEAKRIKEPKRSKNHQEGLYKQGARWKKEKQQALMEWGRFVTLLIITKS